MVELVVPKAHPTTVHWKVKQTVKITFITTPENRDLQQLSQQWIKKQATWNSEKALQRFYCLPLPLPAAHGGLKKPPFPIWELSPWLQREQSRPDSKRILFVCLDLSEGYLKNWHKVFVFVLPNLELSLGRKAVKQRASLKNLVRPVITCCPLGQKISIETKGHIKSLGGKARESFFGKLGHWKVPWYPKDKNLGSHT